MDLLEAALLDYKMQLDIAFDIRMEQEMENEKMGKPHKHAELIKAWADGAEIQYRRLGSNDWEDCSDAPRWHDCHEYRIKPQPRKLWRRLYKTIFNEYMYIVAQAASEIPHFDASTHWGLAYRDWAGGWEEFEVEGE